MTLVFHTKLGPLMETQVGTADIVNVLSAAHSAYGWLGGLDGARFLLSKIPNAFSQKIKALQLDRNLRLRPITAEVLTAAGAILFSLENTNDAFGGDVRTQLIGLTLCALAHEMDGAIAVQLFKICMLDELFEGSSEMANAIHGQLNDESHMQQILNEGAARGLTQVFISATAGLGVAEGDRQWLRKMLYSDDDMVPLTTEVQMVGGLLKWIVSGDTNTYATRSALVSRVAACLRSIGYQIGTIQTWDGTGVFPAHLNRNAVVLVLGGYSQTDRLMLDAEEFQQESRTLHYNYKTVGAMLLNALGNQSDTFPEVFQDHFESIYQYFERAGEPIYELNGVITDMQAKYRQASSPTQSTPLAKRLAAIYFPLSAEIVAHCYSRIATEDILGKLKDHHALVGGFQYIPEAVCVFRAVTAAIVISIASRFGAPNFRESQHAISLSLTNSGWLDCMCKALDRALASGLKYNEIVAALAVIHSAQDPEEALQAKSSVVAWRCGIYSVVPSLLLSMRASPEAIAPKCIDTYWANVIAQENGSINSATTESLLTDLSLIEEIQGGNSSSLQSLSRPWTGSLQPGPSDVPLYITIERPYHYSRPDLCFVGRIGGSVVGSTGVLDVLRGLLRNLDEPDHCPGHVSPLAVINVKASQWAQNRRTKPVGERVHTYVPVQHDDCWAIFLLGQSCYFNGRLALRCADCTVERAGSSSVVVGYC